MDGPTISEGGGEGKSFPVKPLFVIQIAVMVIFGPITWFFGSPQKAEAFEIGALMVLLNFGALALGWSLVFKKKFVALAVPIIVIKYAILGIIIYELSRRQDLDLLWLCLGLASFLVTSLIYAQRQNGI